MVAITWFKVDDGFWSHPKTLQLQAPSVALWVRAGAWACQHLTDGFVPSYALGLFASDKASAEALVDVGYWDEAPGGWVFHDWEDYQEASGTVKARREVRTEAAAKANHVRWHEKPGIVVDDCKHCSEAGSDSDSKAESGGSPPVPTRPDPSASSTKKPSSASRGSRLDPSWLPTAADVAKIRGECADIDPQREHAEFVDYWVGVPGQKGLKLDWSATWRNWMRRKQREFKPSKLAPSARAQRTVMLATDLMEIEQ